MRPPRRSARPAAAVALSLAALGARRGRRRAGEGGRKAALALQQRAADPYAPDEKAGDGVRKRLGE